MCGALAGGPAQWNQRLDAEYAFRTLLAPASPLQLTTITDSAANVRLALRVAGDAQRTAAGRARLALASAVGGIPGWTPGAAGPPGTPGDVEAGQYRYWLTSGVRFFFGYRAELEARAGGSPSWNTGVDYGAELRASGLAGEVDALYRAAGLRLADDLARLAGGERFAADPGAERYLERYATPAGQIDIPVLTLHGVADPQVPAAQEGAYAAAVAAAGRSPLLRQLFVQRAGHCRFTPTEQLAALTALLERVGSGRWPAWLDARLLATRAEAIWSGDQRFAAREIRTNPGVLRTGR
jgi:hypothetical protein